MTVKIATYQLSKQEDTSTDLQKLTKEGEQGFDSKTYKTL
jgi:hypothetical protein